jgi:hypothetical protein
MNTTTNRFIVYIIFLLLAGCAVAGNAQNENASVKAAVEAKQFVFDAQTIVPTGARARQVGGEGYRLRVSGDSLISDLPYFGRAYSASYNGEGGIKFKSASFDYAVKNRKRGGWEIALRPNDVSDFREFVLTVFDNGSAQLRALSNNRQPISYNGTVTALH